MTGGALSLFRLSESRGGGVVARAHAAVQISMGKIKRIQINFFITTETILEI